MPSDNLHKREKISQIRFSKKEMNKPEPKI